MDIRPLPDIEIVGDIRKIPLPDNYVDEIFTQHTLEHFDRSEVQPILREWYRALKFRGILKIRVPNLLFIMNQYFHNPMYKKWCIELLYGGQDYDTNYHRNAFDWPLLYEQLYLAGFRDIKLWGDSGVAGLGLDMQGMKPSPIIPI